MEEPEGQLQAEHGLPLQPRLSLMSGLRLARAHAQGREEDLLQGGLA